MKINRYNGQKVSRTRDTSQSSRTHAFLYALNSPLRLSNFLLSKNNRHRKLQPFRET
ncbi:unnamed protein product [Trichogramma brassicae]|uniref:Uncharacterized protein n=1 Tax=Trichogramma brassicae TaxID=86971 RepID=A0A6H5IN58_9HYME|nr:unnamed protein product [Trichogramma brassicae]